MKPRVFTWLIPGLLLVFCLSLITGPGLASADFGSTEILSAKSLISPNVQSEIQASTPEAMLTVLVTMREQANLNQIIAISRTDRLEQVIDTLKSKANRSQVSIQRLLSQRQSQGLVSQVISFWIFNGLSVTATPSVIQELAGRQDVAQISSDSISILPVTGIPEPNIAAINAPALWTMGYFGQNVIVANLDTGVSMDNPELATRWRGGSNSWYDPYGQHPNSPIDFSGHGSWTMGVMVAGDASGTSIGVAPQAQWIAARIFDDQGKSTTTAIHQALQWILDPDHNPATADAPQVLNNSWTMSNPGCDLTFQLDLQSLRAAGILPVFAAGNFGPNTSTSASPANYPEALAVGAVDNLDVIYAYSSRGPSACSELSTTYPDLVAPGVNIKSTDLYGLYTTNTGTSLAAPHVAGGLALLLSAYPNLPVDVQQSALINSAIDLGNPGQDNTFGAGRLDLLAAYQWISSHSTPTSTPTQTVTSSPTSTPSQTPTVTLTPTVTMTATPTQTATFTSTSTVQPTPTVTQTPTGTATATVLQYHTLLPLLLNKQTP